MNHNKNELAKLLGLSKDERTRSEVLASTDIYVSSKKGPLENKTSNSLPDKAVLISLKAELIEKKAKQTVVSTIPTLPNHITDIHLLAGITLAIAEGKKFSEKTLSEASKALATVYKRPSSKRLIPGLLEKNLAKKIAKGIR